MQISQRLQEIPPSGTVAISNLVNQMKSEGVDIISFSVGEPDFNTPENIVNACADSLKKGFTHYTPSLGIPELRKAIAESTKAKNGIPCEAKNVLVTPTKQALFMIALAYINPGDEVILPDPSWVSYEAHIRMCGGIPKYVTTTFDDGFVIDPEKVQAAVSGKTKMIVINSPSNPTGCVQPESTLKGIADVAKDNDLIVLTDEIYENIIYDGAKHHSIAAMPDMFDRTITVSGLSKTYAMTGWRLGWMIAPEADIKAVNKLQSHSVTCCTSFTQPAAIEAIRGPQTDKENMVAQFKKRRDLALDLISEIPGLECNVPGGAFYLFPKYDAKIPSNELAEKFLMEGHVAVTPGRAFGPAGEGFFRLSYAASESDIVEGLGRIKDIMKSL